MFWTFARYDHRSLKPSGTTAPSPVGTKTLASKLLESVGTNVRTPASSDSLRKRWPLNRNVVLGTTGTGPLRLACTFSRDIGSTSLMYGIWATVATESRPPMNVRTWVESLPGLMKSPPKISNEAS